MTEFKRFTVSLPPDVHKELKLVATESETTMSSIIIDCIWRVVQEHREHREQKDK